MSGQPPDPPSARAERRGELLAELAELGQRLARAAAALAEKQLDEAAVVAWAPNGFDPGAAFVRLAQCVRRTLALEAHLERIGREPEGQARRGEEALFRRGEPLTDCDRASPPPSPAAAEAPRGEAPEPLGRRERLADDLGSFLGPRERLIGDVASADTAIGRICLDLGLDPARLAHDPARGWVIEAGAAGPPTAFATPLRLWRPPRGPDVNAARLE